MFSNLPQFSTRRNISLETLFSLEPFQILAPNSDIKFVFIQTNPPPLQFPLPSAYYSLFHIIIPLVLQLFNFSLIGPSSMCPPPLCAPYPAPVTSLHSCITTPPPIPPPGKIIPSGPPANLPLPYINFPYLPFHCPSWSSSSFYLSIFSLYTPHLWAPSLALVTSIYFHAFPFLTDIVPPPEKKPSDPPTHLPLSYINFPYLLFNFS